MFRGRPRWACIMENERSNETFEAIRIMTHQVVISTIDTDLCKFKKPYL